MTALHIVLTVIQLILAVGLVVIVTLQSGKSAGLSSAIAGGDGFAAKGKSKSLDAKLAKATKWIGGVFIVLTLVLNLF
ncbi:MAG: preprotein translocase subunit SecG [Clostridiales bacterium]|nr:preprotein translocase subunit SecG [Clostridiales bacterium]